MFFRIIIFTFFLSPFLCQSKDLEAQLNTADSLFEKQKYTEALSQYQDIFDQGQASSAMLAKMAFINEGLGNEVEALYYLEQYYRTTSNRKALEKIRELADEHQLSGYQFSDEAFFVDHLSTYRLEIISGLLGLSACLLILMFLKSARGYKSIPWIMGQVIFAGFAFVLINNTFKTREAIISDGVTTIMEGPSSASSAIVSTKPGDKVKLVQDDELWTLIEAENERGFVRSNKLLPL
ncbi:lipopolysaccharide assembly protein LapB [Marinoscillum sp. MHG1-6]|uniref:tetratricopeptide repeat protein n=1 Tax=Marinoscillum sp. MHG1-6 TaxID=2959627 RepID=UPI002157AF5D|nr:hypothetical protein [Marinoscillum sp. MHG1-6]